MDDDDYAFDDYPSKYYLQLIYTIQPLPQPSLPTESTVLTCPRRTPACRFRWSA